MITLFDKNSCIDICCAENECNYIKLAAEDLAKDIEHINVNLNNIKPNIITEPILFD